MRVTIGRKYQGFYGKREGEKGRGRNDLVPSAKSFVVKGNIYYPYKVPGKKN